MIVTRPCDDTDYQTNMAAFKKSVRLLLRSQVHLGKQSVYAQKITYGNLQVV